MKMKMNKIVSSFLAVALLVMCFSVLAQPQEVVSATSDTEQSTALTTDDIVLLINRTYDEGWDYTNGTQSQTSTTDCIFIDYEQSDIDGSYNYFTRIQSTYNRSFYFTLTQNGGHRVKDGITVLKMSLSADDIVDYTSKAIYFTTFGGMYVNLLWIEDNAVYSGINSATNYLGDINGEWLDVTFVFDWTEKQNLTYYSFAGEEPEGGFRNAYKSTTPYVTEGDGGINNLRIGASVASTDVIIGMSYMLDNLIMYNVKEDAAATCEYIDVDVSGLGAGALVSTDATKSINILTSDGSKSITQLLEESLTMKVGVSTALIGGEKQNIFTNDAGEAYGAPVKVDDNVMIPLAALLSHIGYPYFRHPDGMSYDITTGISATYITVGSSVANVAGKDITLAAAPGYVTDENGNEYIVIAYDDIEQLFPGWLACYDDMGLIIVYEDATPDDDTDNEPIVDRESDLSYMLSLAKRFVYADLITEAYESRSEEQFIASGWSLYDLVEENSAFDHPYVLANQDRFDMLYNIYWAVNNGDIESEYYDETIYSYLSSWIWTANAYYQRYALGAQNNATNATAVIEDDYDSHGLQQIPVNPNNTPDGYDSAGGRLNASASYNTYLLYWAFAYQVTGYENYAKLAYDFSLAMGEWTHWGPGHFLNCADATYPFAISYDWFYDCWTDMGLDTSAIAKIIFDLGVHDGYLSTHDNMTDHVSNLVGTGGHKYHERTNNWNAVCCSGMIIGALAILGDVQLGTFTDEETEEIMYMIGDSLEGLVRYGLDCYAPDGSYAESPTYWTYGTNSLFRMTMALWSAAGTDLGLLDACGVDVTSYFAVWTEYDGSVWNFNDSGSGSQDCSYFFFLSEATNDTALYYLRNKQLEDGSSKSVTIYDLLYIQLNPNFESVELGLDYVSYGIDLYIARSSWESGALFAGIIADNSAASHADIDSGNFIYYNEGIKWIVDLGADEYNIKNYFGDMRQYYYTRNAEGHNTVIVSTEPDKLIGGQLRGAYGTITDYYANEYGSYVVVDNSTAYGTDIVGYARRGLLVTNYRQTVVVQDEIAFNSVQDSYWIAHTNQEIEISDDGRTAYLIYNKDKSTEKVLRATIVSASSDLKFEVLDTYTFLLSSTYTKEETGYNGIYEYDRAASLKRLVVRNENAISLNISVVFEMVESVHTADEQVVGYEWTQMQDWVPGLYDGMSSGGSENMRDDATRQMIVDNANSMYALFISNAAYDRRLSTLYTSLATVRYCLLTIPTSALTGAYRESYQQYLEYKANYEAYRDKVNSSGNLVYSLTTSLSGME